MGKADLCCSLWHVNPLWAKYCIQGKSRLNWLPVYSLSKDEFTCSATVDTYLKYLKGLFHPACLARAAPLFAFVVAMSFVGPMKWRQQKPTERRYVQGMLDETDPLRPRSHCSVFIWKRSKTSPFLPCVDIAPLWKWSFSKTLMKIHIFENDAFSLWTPKTETFENAARSLARL